MEKKQCWHGPNAECDECRVDPLEVSALDIQIGGDHYREYKIQPKEFFIVNNIPAHKASIIERILRFDHETGKGMEDLQKAKHEIDLIVEIDKKWDLKIFY